MWQRKPPSGGGGPQDPRLSWSKRRDVVEKARRRRSLGSWWVGVQRSCWQDVVEKASTLQKAEPPGLRLSSPGEQERHNADGHKSGGQYIAVMFGLQLPLTIKPWITFSNPYSKVRGTHFVKEVFARPLSLCRWDSFSMYMHVYM